MQNQWVGLESRIKMASDSQAYFDVLLLGKVGRGKSTTGNKLLGLDESCFDQLYKDQDTGSGNVISVPNRTGMRIKVWRMLPQEREVAYAVVGETVIVGELQRAGFFPPDEEGAVEMKTRVCKLLSNEETLIRVLDCPGFGNADKDIELMDANLQVMDSVIRRQKGDELKFSRVLYLLPQRGALEKADGELQEEMKAMSLVFGRKIFDSMVVIATYSPRQSMRGMKFEEDDIQFTQKAFTEALKKVLGEENPSCPPVVYISLKDSPDEVREMVQIAKVNSEVPLYPAEFHDKKCTKCDLGVVEINGQRVMAKHSDGQVSDYKKSKCHPTFQIRHSCSVNVARVVTLGFYRSDDSSRLCSVCDNSPGSPGCCCVSLDGQGPCVDHTVEWTDECA